MKPNYRFYYELVGMFKWAVRTALDNHSSVTEITNEELIDALDCAISEELCKEDGAWKRVAGGIKKIDALWEEAAKKLKVGDYQKNIDETNKRAVENRKR